MSPEGSNRASSALEEIQVNSIYRLTLICSLVGILPVFSINAVAQDAADYVIHSGRIYTVNEAQPWAEAVAVRGNEIVYVGNSAGVAGFVGEGTIEVDLDERLMLPGFVESHIHAAVGGATTSGVILETTDTIDDVLQKIEEYAAANPDKEVIFGASYFSGLFDAQGPNKGLLDEIVSDRPVYLIDQTLHSAWVNTKAFEIAGITRETPNPDGGEYVRS